MVGFTKVFVTALLAVTATALPRPANEGKGNNGNEKGNNTGNGNGGSTELPVVDLGYAVHQGTLETSNYKYYNFSNIRFADPPVGSLRFAAPQKVSTVNRTVSDGSEGRVCIQASPGWASQEKYFEENITVADLGKQGPKETEDCLFLDVFVPQKVYDSEQGRRTRKKHGKASQGAPVLVWIYGGGFTGGNKVSGNPATLISHAEENDGEGIVFVAMNYRVGLFGFLGGPTFQTNGTANAGFYDQRLALEWVRENIYLFGGDPDRVTLMGESAGGSSIMHQLTAFGGQRGPVPFARMISQSPGLQPIASNIQKESIFTKTLEAASKLGESNVTSVEGLRKLDAETLRNTNSYVVALSGQGTWTYGPVVDGLFAPATAPELLLHGQYDKGVEIMVGHNVDEGAILADQSIDTQEEFRGLVKTLAPAASDEAVKLITEEFYPPIYDGSRGYKSASGRTALLISETGFTCYTRTMMKAKKGEGYSYLFSVPPALHGQDVGFTFYNPTQPDMNYFGIPLTINATVATTMQKYFVNFALNGSPNEGANVPFFPQYGTNETITNLGVKGIPLIQLDTVSNQPNGTNNAGDRCDWYAKGLFF